MTDVLALDIASMTGWCRGGVGSTPTCGSIRFAAAGASQGAIFGNAFDWFCDFTKDHRPDALIIEALLPFAAGVGKTNKNTGDILAGLHGVIRAIAYKRQIFEIHTVSVGDARQHFIDSRTFKGDKAKRYVMDKCRALGWQVKNDNESDAAAIWSYWCSRIDPKQALRVSPLFNRMVNV